MSKPKFAYYNDSILKNELVNYDVVIMDDGSLNNNEIKLLESFVKNNKNRKLLYTSRLDNDYINNFIGLGIEGILSKRADLEKLSEAVLAVSNSKKYFGEYIIKYANENNKIEKLSSREKEIFSLTQNLLLHEINLIRLREYGSETLMGLNFILILFIFSMRIKILRIYRKLK